MKKGIFFLILIIFFNCSKTNKKDIVNKVKSDTISSIIVPKSDFYSNELQENLNKAILGGDTIAYRKCYKKYTINGKDKEFLYYAIVMAEKNNYKGAYYDVFRILAVPTDDPLYKKYKFSSKLGQYSLFKSYEMKADGAIQDIKTFYLDKNKLVPRSSSIYCK